jgi:RNA polymerase sigma-70 factor (ECF subfamily)
MKTQPRPSTDRGTARLSDAEPCCEEDSLIQAKAGHELAFACLVRTHQASIFSLALRILNDREQARDVAQDVFIQLYRKLQDIESARHLKFWLRKVAANLSIDRVRHVQRLDVMPIEDQIDRLAAAPEADSLLQSQLLKLVGELPPSPRAVMLLRYQEDLDPVDIARALEMPLNTVKSHLKRSLTALRERVMAEGNYRDRQLS